MNEVLLYGKYRYIEDFRYLFDNRFKIVGYIDSVNDETNKLYEPSYDIDSATAKKFLVVICERKNNEIIKKIKENGFKKYVFIEDLGYLLNDKLENCYEKIIRMIHRKSINKYYTNAELFKKMIYSDQKNGIFCKEPFEYFSVQPYGFVYSCCPSYGYSKIGNILLKPIDKVWNSNAAKLKRLSIINRTYAFCDSKSCPQMKFSKLLSMNLKRYKVSGKDNINRVYVGIDKTCNLYCKSCREKVIYYKGIKLKIAQKLAKKLINSNEINNANNIVLAGQGEVFFSKTYKYMLFESNFTKRDNIEIITNGNLLTKENLDKLISLYDNITINISIDAATEETYKKIRRGGNFKKLCDNLEYLKQIKKSGKIKKVVFYYVVQRKNYIEMPMFIEMAEKYDADLIYFTGIENWGTYSNKDFKKVSMINSDETKKIELKKVLKNPKFSNSTVEIVKTNIFD